MGVEGQAGEAGGIGVSRALQLPFAIREGFVRLKAPEQEGLIGIGMRQFLATTGHGDESQAPEMGRLVAPTRGAILFLDSMRRDCDPARVRIPIRAREETAVGIVSPGIEVLITDAGQVGVGPQELIGDAGAFANHLAIFDRPTLEILRGFEVWIDGDQGEGGDVGHPIGMIDLGGTEREQELDGELGEELRGIEARVGLVGGTENYQIFAGGIKVPSIQDAIVFE